MKNVISKKNNNQLFKLKNCLVNIAGTKFFWPNQADRIFRTASMKRFIAWKTSGKSLPTELKNWIATLYLYA